VSNASAHKPCSASAHTQGSAGDTHGLRDGDEADTDKREKAAVMPAEPGEWRQSDPSYSHVSPPLLLFFSFRFSLSRVHSLSLNILSNYVSFCPCLYPPL
jgi:hypothetical protein